jgi:hypothetical protein
MSLQNHILFYKKITLSGFTKLCKTLHGLRKLHMLYMALPGFTHEVFHGFDTDPEPQLPQESHSEGNTRASQQEQKHKDSGQ